MNGSVISLETGQEASAPAVAESAPAMPAAQRSTEALLRALATEPVEPQIFEHLARSLARETKPQRIWHLLRCMDHAPRGSVALEAVFAALTRLAAADSVFLRAAAYERLAGLHRLNLRFEMRAKLVMRKGLDRETGLAKLRLKALLRLC
ncbi:MAG: hypothetical protein AAGE43_14520 [Pseudomonadota bacterium]